MGFWANLGSAALTSGLGPLGGVISSSLFGSKSTTNLDMATNAQRNLRESQDVAGSAGNQETSAPTFAKMGAEAGKQIGELGNKFASQFTEELATRFIRRKADKWFGDKPETPFERGVNQRTYNQAAYPGVNPWEIAGGGGAASTAGGGSAATQQQRESARDVSHISTAPAIKRAEIEYQTLHPKVKLLEQQAKTGKAQEVGISATTGKTIVETKWLPTLNNIKANLERAQTFKAGSEDTKIQEDAKLRSQQLITEIQKSGIAKANNKIQSVIAEYIHWIKGAAIVGGAATGALILGKLLRVLTGIGGKVMAGGAFKGKGITSAPRTGKDFKNWRNTVKGQMKDTAKKYE